MERKTIQKDDPRVTKTFTNVILFIFLIVGIFLTLIGVWVMGLFFLIVTFLSYRCVRRDIHEKGVEYASKGEDTTIDSINEAKEIFSEIKEEVKGSFQESIDYVKEGNNTFQFSNKTGNLKGKLLHLLNS